MPCPYCTRDHKRSKNGPCPACYMAIYTDTPKGKARYDSAKRKYEASDRGRATRREWLPDYRIKRGIYVHPDVVSLREAVRTLERAVAAAGQRAPIRGAGERSGDDGTERDIAN